MVRHFKQVWRDHGVDEDSTYNLQPATWLMAPEGRFNCVLLHDAQGLKWKADSKLTVHEVDSVKEVPKGDVPDAAQVKEAIGRAAKESARLLFVKGSKRGAAKIELLDGRTVKETLAVSVHERLDLTLSFHFLALKDGTDKPPLLSKSRNSSHVKQWIADLNRIFTPQANIVFASQKARPLPVDAYRGSSVVYKDADEWTNEIGKFRDTSAHSNVFIVGQWKGTGDDKWKDVNGTYIISTRDIVCDDRPSYDLFLTTLAHELGHFLGYRRNIPYGHPGPKNSLLTTLNWQDGIKIPRQFVQDFNPI